MTQIEFTRPDKDTPGHLRRLKMVAKFNGLKDEDFTLEFYNEMIEFLLAFITKPTDRDEARAILEDASEAEFKQMMTGSVGGGSEDAGPLSTAAQSGNTSEVTRQRRRKSQS